MLFAISHLGRTFIKYWARQSMGSVAALKRVVLVVGICLVAILLLGGPALAATKVTVTISDVRSTSVQVSWTETNDTCFKDYRLQYQRTTAAGWSDDVVINSSTTTSYRSVGYTPEVTYNFRVVDEDCTSVQASDPVSFRTLPGPNLGAAAAAGIGALVLLLVILVVIAAAIGFVVQLAKRAAARALVGLSKNPPTATLPGTSSTLPTPTPWDSSTAFQGGQPSAPSAAQPAAPVPLKFCTSCGSPLNGPFCAKCGNKNW